MWGRSSDAANTLIPPTALIAVEMRVRLRRLGVHGSLTIYRRLPHGFATLHRRFPDAAMAVAQALRNVVLNLHLLGGDPITATEFRS